MNTLRLKINAQTVIDEHGDRGGLYRMLAMDAMDAVAELDALRIGVAELSTRAADAEEAAGGVEMSEQINRHLKILENSFEDGMIGLISVEYLRQYIADLERDYDTAVDAATDAANKRNATELARLRDENSDLRAANDRLRAEAVDAQRRIKALEAEQVPNWSKAPDWAQWWAVDADGWRCWYSGQPEAKTKLGYWSMGAGECERIERQPPPVWYRSARRRPQVQP